MDAHLVCQEGYNTENSETITTHVRIIYKLYDRASEKLLMI
jgi:hypothetical protein